MNYIGKLNSADQLYGYLREDILPLMGLKIDFPEFRVFQAFGSHNVYLYEEVASGRKVIGKFFGGLAEYSPDKAWRRLDREFKGLAYLRQLGFDRHPHYVARPLGCRADIDYLLVVEHCEGVSLMEVLRRAIEENNSAVLYQKLTALAYFLASLHNRTVVSESVDFQPEIAYGISVTRQLTEAGHLTDHAAQDFRNLMENWRFKPDMWADRRVLVHGDMTPANVLFGEGLWVITFDLERMRHSDRMFDVGRLSGELKHFFMKHGRGRNAAEPFIGHFLWQYAGHFPDQQQTFAAITRRLPYYMAITLLRVSRNSWISGAHRRELLEQATKTLS